MALSEHHRGCQQQFSQLDFAIFATFVSLSVIANAMLLIPNDAIFIHVDMKKENLKNKKKLTLEGKMTSARG